ncbi:MAG: SMC family ATPase [Cyanobacteria bacterium P01_D01_bin.44]
MTPILGCLMHLLSVTLNNFKTHSDLHVEFQPGTNAICGENGAGKTSILEAIAWALFNYQGSYTKEDLIRNGSGSAQARVAFVSNRDSRTYEVERCTNRGYTLFDPQLNERLPYTRIKDEVLPWLRQHLGVTPGTDLGELFANTIGVPQGTFTADFLLSPDKRKPIFDTILKVEEYRAVYQQTNSLRKYAEAQVQRLKNQIAQYAERLEIWDALKQNHDTIQAEIAASQTQLQQLEIDLAALQASRTALAHQAEQLQSIQQQRQRLTSQLTTQQQAQQRLAQAIENAQQALNICQQQQTAYATFLAADQTVKQLETQAQDRQALFEKQQKQQTALDQRKADLTRLQLQLEQTAEMQQALTELQPAIQQQQQLETQITTLQTQQQNMTQAKLQQKSLQAQLEGLSLEQTSVRSQISTLLGLQATVDQIPTLEAQQRRLQQQLSRIEAAQQFEAELQHLVTQSQDQQATYTQQSQTALQALDELQMSIPLLSGEVIEQLRSAISTGQTLTQKVLEAVDGILQDLAQQVNEAQLQNTLKTVQASLKKAYQDQATLATLPLLQQKQTQLQTQQTQLQTDLTKLGEQVVQAEAVTAQLADLTHTLAQLNDPKGRSRLLQERLAALSSVQADHDRFQQIQAKLEAQLAETRQQLDTFAALDADITLQRQLMQTHQAGYQLYLQNQKAADTLPQLQTEQQTIATALATLTEQQQTIEAQYQTLSATFDPKALQVIETRYVEVKSQCDRILGSLPQQQKLQQSLASQIEALQTIAEKRDQSQATLKQKERTKRFVNFARKVYKEAGPRITERYVHKISQTADRIFRELLNRSNVSLQWTRDYEISVQEGANPRRFINLSGGEQMCAALSVRLALLKTLADIDIAFFDEPTTNMDRPRRESLAEAIARLKSFQQLFVISHDDTFEKVTENVIIIERQT